MGKVYKDDFGTVLDLDAGEDVSDASSLRIYFKKPSGATGSWAADLEGVSLLRYVTETGDINEDGIWSLQARVVTAAGTWRGETAKLRVWAHYE